MNEQPHKIKGKMKNVKKILWKDRDEDEEILCITFSTLVEKLVCHNPGSTKPVPVL